MADPEEKEPEQKEPEQKEPEQKSLIRQVADWLDSAKAILVFAGLLLYAAMRLYAEAFYARFDATPEEAGLTYLSILTRAALGLASIVLVFAVLSIPLAAIATAVGSRGRKGASGDAEVPRKQVVAFVGLGLVAGFGMIVQSFGDQEPTLIVLALLLVFEAGVVALNKWQPSNDGLMQARWLCIGLLAAVTAACLLFTAYSAGLWDADKVAAGEELEDKTLFGLVAVRADCVLVTWTSGPAPEGLDLEAPFLLLGHADGQAILTRKKPKQKDPKQTAFSRRGACPWAASS